MSDQTFGRHERLAGPLAFRTVFGHRCSLPGRCVILYARPNGLTYNRLGLSVGRRFGIATARNRFKRLCREAFRLTKDRQPQGFDWVVVPKATRRKGDPQNRNVPWDLTDIRDDLLNLMRRLARRSRRRPTPTAKTS